MAERRQTQLLGLEDMLTKNSTSENFRLYLGTVQNGGSFWRFLLSVVVLIGALALGLFALAKLSNLAERFFFETSEELLFLTRLVFEDRIPGDMSANWIFQFFTCVFLAFFFAVWPALWLCQRTLGLSFGSLFSWTGKFRWGRFVRASLIALVCYLLLMMMSLSLDLGPITWEVRVWDWALASLIMLPLVFFQAGAEELLFRGWMLQQLGRLWTNPIFLCLMTSGTFAFLHADNPGVSFYGYFTLIYFFLSGVLFFWIIRREGGLEVVIAMHWLWNWIGMSLVRSTDNSDQAWMGQFTLLIYDGPVPTKPELMLLIGASLLLEVGIVLLLFHPRSPIRLRNEGAT